MSAFSALDHLECPRCGATHDATVLQGLCSRCASPLLARYDLSGVRATRAEVGARPPDLWRYHELLPVSGPDHVVTLGEGMTPLLPAPRLGAELGIGRLLVKDDGLLPTGSFKARGAAVGVARARELGATALAMPTNGNAGAAWATYAARAGLRMSVVMPVSAPTISRAEVVAAGGELTLVDGLISDAGQLVGAAIAEAGDSWFDAGTLKEPYRIEGKKTMGFEIAEQLGWRMPDVIIYPTGGGVGLIGIAKAFAELRELGWLTGPPTRFVAAQSTGCAPVVKAFADGDRTTAAWPDPHTVAYGITVAAPLGGPQLLRILRESGGTAVAVDDADALATRAACAAEDGMLLSPEGAVALHAVRTLAAAGRVTPDERVVVLNTGSALIQPETLPEPAGLLSPTAELP
jgi:threonine synthase